MDHQTDPSETQVTSSITRPKISVPLLVAIVAVIVAAGSFFGGVEYQKGNQKTVSTTTTRGFSQSGTTTGTGGFSGQRRGGFGTVSAITTSSISLTNARTSTSTTYSITSATTVTDAGSASTVSAIQTGDRVMVTTASTSSTVATQISINPTMGGFGGSGSMQSSMPAPASTT
jgi:hypothetical protein